MPHGPALVVSAKGLDDADTDRLFKTVCDKVVEVTPTDTAATTATDGERAGRGGFRAWVEPNKARWSSPASR
jgi:hypothetical protein